MWTDLIEQYSLQNIVIYTIMFIIAMKGSFDFFDWVKLKYKEKFDKDYNRRMNENLTKEHYESCQKRFQESVDAYNNMEKKIDTLTETINTRFNKIEDSIQRLTESDMHDIKGWIVERHHKLMAQGWVDDFTMDTLEKRFSDYKIEGGNSYIEGLMNEIRALPHTPINKGED